MNLLEIRTQFIKISGRYDLITDPGFIDNGANFYIQQGQRSLERRTNIHPTNAKVFKTIQTNDYLIELKHCRVIKHVWLISEEAKVQLTKILRSDLLKLKTLPPLKTSSGTPFVYYLTNLIRSPNDIDSSTDSTLISNYNDTVSPTDPSLTGLVIYPPADKSYGLEISGLFYNLPLVQDTDSNYWTVNFPALLIMATMQQLEIMYRGSKSATSWDILIEAELANIDKDQVEQDIVSIDQIEG